MRIIEAREIRDIIAELVVKANISLRKDILAALKKALRSEKGRLARNVLNILVENAKIAEDKTIPICQDTGMTIVFCRIGEDVRVKGDINKAIDDGIRLGSKKGCLRRSIVSDPLLRKNTGTNAPCIIHYDFVKGRRLELIVLPKGFGSENVNRIAMLRPTDGEKEIIDFIVRTIIEGGADACPPLILGIGIGGTQEKAALLAKEATLRPINRPNPKNHLARLERLILSEVNKTKIGPAGLGGETTCLGVNILSFPTHIAGLPVCINISCHALRSASRLI